MSGIDDLSPQELTLRFAEIVLGVEVCEGPPPPDSPLGRYLAMENPTEEDIRALMREGDD